MRKKIDFDLDEFRNQPLPSEKKIISGWTGNRDKPLVSVICNTYNQENYIEDAIRGFLLQETDFPFEVIINDDASTDRNPEIISRYADKYPKIIKPVFQKENQYSQGRKPTIVSFRYTSGRYIALCEGDDFWIVSNKLQYQFNKIEKNINIDGCAHAALMLYSSGYVNSINNYESSNLSCDFVIRKGGGVVPTASLFLRRSVIEKFSSHYINAPLGDYFIQVLAAENGGLSFDNEAKSVYRYASGNSISQAEKKKDSEKIRQFVEQFENSLDQLEHNLQGDYRESILEFKVSVYKEAAIRALVYADDKKLFLFLVELSKQRVLGVTHKFILFFYKYPAIVKVAYRMHRVFSS